MEQVQLLTPAGADYRGEEEARVWESGMQLRDSRCTLISGHSGVSGCDCTVRVKVFRAFEFLCYLLCSCSAFTAQPGPSDKTRHWHRHHWDLFTQDFCTFRRHFMRLDVRFLRLGLIYIILGDGKACLRHPPGDNYWQVLPQVQVSDTLKSASVSVVF